MRGFASAIITLHSKFLFFSTEELKKSLKAFEEVCAVIFNKIEENMHTLTLITMLSIATVWGKVLKSANFQGSENYETYKLLRLI